MKQAYQIEDVYVGLFLKKKNLCGLPPVSNLYLKKKIYIKLLNRVRMSFLPNQKSLLLVLFKLGKKAFEPFESKTANK